MVFTIFEILDVAVMTFVLGFIFHDVFRKPMEKHDVLDRYRAKRGPFGIDWQDFWWACAILAPTILIHELMHKFSAMGFGLDATFHAACSTAYLMPGGEPFLNFYCLLTAATVVMKMFGVGMLFFIPGFVEIGAGGTAWQYAATAFAGPAVHLIFWLGAAYILKDTKRMKRLSHKKRLYLFFFKQINMFLFILNMLPIPGFDGFKVFMYLFKLIF
jgi:Zn-dependent protease